MIEIPTLDARDEDTVTAEVTDALPAELTDRNRSSPVVAVVEAIGTFYALFLALVNSLPTSLELVILNLLGLEKAPTTSAIVELDFTSTAAGLTVPAGYIVKTGSDADAIKFSVDSELVVAPSSTSSVSATATTGGAAGNVGAGTLTKYDAPLAGLDSVTNPAAASGGTDEETLASVKSRATIEQRALEKAVSDPDFELHTKSVAGVERVKALGSQGVEVLHIFVDDLNERYFGDILNGTDAAIRAAVKGELELRAHGGIAIVVNQPTPRLVVVDEIEVELEAGASPVTVGAAIVQAASDYLNPFDTYASDGATLEQAGWGFGESLFDRELAVLLDAVTGVKRIGQILISYSDDFGATWTPAAAFVELEAAAGGLVVPYGMLAWGADSFAGYALTLTEL